MRDGLNAYFAQFRALSEAYWSTHQELSLDVFRERGVGGATWTRGTRWKPALSQTDIDRIEADWGATFPQEYRAYLATLNAPDHPAQWFLYEGAEIQPKGPGRVFTDWSYGSEDADIAEDKLIGGLIFDVENNALWKDAWGDRPVKAEDRAMLMSDLVAAAPKLIPLHSHRFLVAGLDVSPAPVLSIMQSDIVYFADSIEQCLEADFPELALGLDAPYVDISEKKRLKLLSQVPFWGDLIT